MTKHCRTCHCDEDADRDQRIAARVEMFARECETRGWPIRSGRVSEKHAAGLLGIAKRTLEGWRLYKPGKGPMAHHQGVVGSQWSYKLIELAAWEAAQEEGESWSYTPMDGHRQP